MARRRKGARALGPYKHGRQWRVFVVDDGGDKNSHFYATEEEAEQVIRSLTREFDGTPPAILGNLLEAYKAHLVGEKGNKATSAATTIYRLKSFFPALHLRVTSLSATKCADFYSALTSRVQTDTHRNTLAEVKTFFNWCVAKEHLRRSPVADLKGVGKRQKGKPQHRAAESRLFLDRALAESAAGNDGSFAAATALLLGVRQNAITRRLVRDVDLLTRRLYIEGDKTAAGQRQVEIPEILWLHFEQRVIDRLPASALLPANSKDGFHRKEWVRNNTRRICSAVDIPVICAHGLRGTHATLAQDAGVTGHLVAQQLGHENTATTFEHYTRQSAVDDARQRTVLKVLTGGKSSS